MRRVPLPPVILFRAVALVLLALVTGGRTGASSGDEAPYRVLAGPYSKKEAKEGTAHTEARTRIDMLGISVEFLGPEERAAFVKSIDPTTTDPFASRPGRPASFSTFRVAFDNRSTADVQFQPGNVIMLTDRKTQDFPVDLTDLYRLAAEVGVADPEKTIDRIAPIMFDSSTTIHAGRRIERLLVFGPFPAKWRELQLHFSFLQIGTQTKEATFHFHKQPLKE
ncbi:MAG TPA: hypothetical protein VKF61_03875 [Candidatus Polarisedimenticolia bacterium]|nr:hypothetical protein [Candidatus Polarisedimenticolia bacterium]